MVLLEATLHWSSIGDQLLDPDLEASQAKLNHTPMFLFFFIMVFVLLFKNVEKTVNTTDERGNKTDKEESTWTKEAMLFLL